MSFSSIYFWLVLVAVVGVTIYRKLSSGYLVVLSFLLFFFVLLVDFIFCSLGTLEFSVGGLVGPSRRGGYSVLYSFSIGFMIGVCTLYFSSKIFRK